VKDKYVKDAARDVAEDVTQDLFILSILISQRRNPRPTHACRPKRLSLGDT